MDYRHPDEAPTGEVPARQVMLLNFVPDRTAWHKALHLVIILMLAAGLMVELPGRSFLWAMLCLFYAATAGVLLLVLAGTAQVCVTLTDSATGRLLEIEWREKMQRKTWQRRTMATPVLLLEAEESQGGSPGREGQGVNAFLQLPGGPKVWLVRATRREDILLLQAEQERFEQHASAFHEQARIRAVRQEILAEIAQQRRPDEGLDADLDAVDHDAFRALVRGKLPGE